MVAAPPTFSHATTYLSWGGTDGGASGDIWQSGVHLCLDSTGTPALSPDPYSAGDLSELWVSVISPWMASAGAFIRSGAVLRWVKAAQVDIHGKYTAEPTFISPAPTPGPVGGNGEAGPQDSVVYTLWSGQTLGKGNYGRVYSPWSAAPVADATGVIMPFAQGQILAAAVSLIGGIQVYATSKQSGVDVVIMSRLTPKGPATAKPVTVVKVGAVKDTQRRRRSALAEAYLSAPIV